MATSEKDEVRTRLIVFRATPSEQERIERHARQQERTVSSAIRLLIAKGLDASEAERA